YIFQYFNGPLYVDQLEALDSCSAAQQTHEGARSVMLAGLKDKYHGLRIFALNNIDLEDSITRASALPVIREIAASDPKTLVRAAALQNLASMRDPSNRHLFDVALKSRS